MPKPLDSGDLDAIRELRGLHGYTLVFMRITDAIKVHQAALEKPQDEVNTNFLRGSLAGLRLALEIPEIIESEARQAVGSEDQHGR